MDINLMSFPEYREAWNYLQQLRAQVTERETRVARLQHSIDYDPMTGERRQLREQQDQQTMVAAQSLMEGQAIADDVHKVVNEMSATRKELNILRRAVKVQERQVEKLRAKYSREICEKVRPAYSRILQRMAAAMVELEAAAREEEQLRDELEQAQVIWASWIRPMGIGWIGRRDDRTSRVSYYLGDVRSSYPEVAKALRLQG